MWEDVNQHIRFVDVTEECRSLYGRVQSNCSLLEVCCNSLTWLRLTDTTPSSKAAC